MAELYQAGAGDGQLLHIDALMHDATMLDEIELPAVLQCKALVETLAGVRRRRRHLPTSVPHALPSLGSAPLSPRAV